MALYDRKNHTSSVKPVILDYFYGWQTHFSRPLIIFFSSGNKLYIRIIQIINDGSQHPGIVIVNDRFRTYRVFRITVFNTGKQFVPLIVKPFDLFFKVIKS
ncbi:hypothetical protein CWG65_23695 [Salmonella enterica subsp. enterica serovar Cotham]|uniref:Uncharacterized protein n=1 Tax=Salmonella enterica subsp. enterica serovar Cotham TaxID=2572724 RepID=A0A603JZU8_SALET|nr:hypothetical protein [Salmonella enterica]EBS2731472.1 hypothetical protein [Salmonella enterica subsp. enterica serovar Cotham]EBX2705844.1 hypothetical protein [Salmonella enterica subsp. enterica serovar Bredeney]ECC3392917.1 hypothetical protein [Salmonella enterica subsp. enterica serovar Agbeni]ECT8366520.1 hypothetical protein [Salmonella enterica subsp. enterica serovar O rough]